MRNGVKKRYKRTRNRVNFNKAHNNYFKHFDHLFEMVQFYSFVRSNEFLFCG